MEHSHAERDAYLRRQFGLKMEKLYGIPYVAPSLPPPPPSLPAFIRTEEDTGVENDDEEEEEERRQETEADEAEHTLLLQERGEGGMEGEKEVRKEEKRRKEAVGISPRARVPEKGTGMNEEGKKGTLSAEEEDILKGLFDFRLARFRREVQTRGRRERGSGKEVGGGERARQDRGVGGGERDGGGLRERARGREGGGRRAQLGRGGEGGRGDRSRGARSEFLL